MVKASKIRLLVALALALALVLSSTVPVLGAVTSFVAEDDEGVYNEYNYADLLASYVSYTLDADDPAALLYLDFAAMVGTRAVFDTGRGFYVDFDKMLAAYAADVENFVMEDYIATSAVQATMPETIKVVTVVNGEIVRTEKGVVPVDPVDPDDPDALRITKVTVLTELGQHVRLDFSKPLSALSAADVSIINKNTRASVGVETVSLASDRKSAQIRFLADDPAENVYILARGETYTFTVTADGETASKDYQRPNYVHGRVIEIDHEEVEFVVEYEDAWGWMETVNIKVVGDYEVDLEYVYGREMRVWYNNDDELVDHIVVDETVRYDAIEVTKDMAADNKVEVELKVEGRKFELHDDVVVRIDGENKDKADFNKDDEYHYAKLVFKGSRIIFVNAYAWEDFLVVEEVDGTDIIAFGEDLDAEDMIIVKDGYTIGLDDLEMYDILFYSLSANDDDGYGEVYNVERTGRISDITAIDFRVAGTRYRYNANNRYDRPMQYIDEDNELDDFDEDIAEEMYDEGEDVTVLLDRFKRAVFITGDRGDVLKTEFVGFLYKDLRVYRDGRSGNLKLAIDIINENGRKVNYDVLVNDLDAHNLGALAVDDTPILRGDLVRLKVDSSGDIEEVWKAFVGAPAAGDNEKFGKVAFTKTAETDDSYIEAKRMQSSTVVFLTEEFNAPDWDEDEIDVVRWGDITRFSEIKAPGSFVYFNDKDFATYVVANETDIDADTSTRAAVITYFRKLTGKDVYAIDAFVGGTKKTYYTSDTSSVYNYFRSVANDITGSISNRNYIAVKFLEDDVTGEIVNKASDPLNFLSYMDVGGETLLTVVSRSAASREIEVKNSAGTTRKFRLVDAYQVFNADDKEMERLQDIKVGDKDKVLLVRDVGNFVMFVITDDPVPVVVVDPVTISVKDATFIFAANYFGGTLEADDADYDLTNLTVTMYGEGVFGNIDRNRKAEVAVNAGGEFSFDSFPTSLANWQFEVTDKDGKVVIAAKEVKNY